MLATVTEDRHPLLTVTLRVDLGEALTRPMPHVGPMNTATEVADLYDSDPFDHEVRWMGLAAQAGVGWAIFVLAYCGGDAISRYDPGSRG